MRVAVVLAAVSLILAAQASRPNGAVGMTLASEFGRWSAPGLGPIAGTGQPEGFVIEAAVFTLPDGTYFDPLAVGTPLLISDGPNSETVVPLGLSCPGGGQSCSVTADFIKPHPGRFTVSSGSQGLQEAINYAGPGGWVVDDIPVVTLRLPLLIPNTVRLTGRSAMDNGVGSQIIQATPNADTIQVGTASSEAQDVVLQYLMAVGAKGDGSDSGVAIHCVNCAKLKLEDVTAKNAHDGLYLDSVNGAAFDATVTGSHFIGNYYGVHIVGGSANRDTFVGNTVDGNVYGVFDDGGWVHTWLGNDIESNTQFGYWQQVSNPAQWSGHNVVLHGNYFERNGSTAGQGDVYLGQLVSGGTGNNGAGCINCEISDNLFNAAAGGNVTAVSFGAVQGTVQNNTFSGYGTGKQYAWITGPAPNFSNVLDLGDGTSPGTITRLDPNGTLTLGGSDQLNDQFGTKLHDTTIESPTGKVSIRGVPGGASASNVAILALEGNSTSVKSNELRWRNQGTDEWGIKNDVAGANAHDFCLANDYANPAAATCDLYLNQQKHFQFSGAGVPGNITFDADYRFKQQANGDPAIQVMRATDTSPSGYLLDLEDSTESHPLFRVDASGNTSINGTLTVQGAAVEPAVGAQTGTVLAGTYAAGACLTGGVSFSGGVAMGMAVATNPESVPPPGLVWNVYIDASNHATIRVCNATSGSIVWAGGSVWDVRVLP